MADTKSRKKGAKVATGKPRPKRQPPEKKNRLGVWTLFILVALVGAYLGVLELSRPHVRGNRLLITEYLEAIEKGRVKNATILDEDNFFEGEYVTNEGVTARYNAPVVKTVQREVLLEFLYPNRVPTTVNQQVGKRVAGLAAILLPGLMIVVFFGYLILSFRRGTGLFSIRSGARKVTADDSPVRFADIAGQDAAVAELREIKEFLANPAQFTDVGAAIPKGVLMYGPPGNGKTMLARALAGEAGASFYSISGSDFVEVYVGVGASRVRDLFREARQNAPAIIFIDELDAVGRSRGRVGVSVSNSEQEQALNQILAEMDGFSTSDGIIVIGATNRPDILDPALLRPGRFDRTIGVEAPGEEARLAILNVHAKGKVLAPNVDLATIASRAHGMTGADLANVMNEAGLLAGRAGKPQIEQTDLKEALKRAQDAPDRQRRLSLRTRSIGRRVAPEERVLFSDVAGQKDAVAELEEIREFLIDPEKFTSVGASIPKGLLLFGPPGCGKTMLAKALACETNASFISVSGSEFAEVFVGEGASRVRDLFAEARSMPPAILFIDEIDAAGQSRGGGSSGVSLSSGERESTLNQILAEMDGFTTTSGIIVVAATNRPDALDAALLRPGRFDRMVGLQLPDEAGRLEILEIHARGKVLGSDVDLAAIAAKAYGLTGADLAQVMNEGALLAGRAEKEAIAQVELLAALKRVQDAPEQHRRLSMRRRTVGRRGRPESKVTFDDVAGQEEAVQDLKEIREYLINPEKFTAVGASIPRGVLLFGPPGCGKTMLARALATEAHAAFISLAGSEVSSKWGGDGAERVRDLFSEARAMPPAILFIDEVDSIGYSRSTGTDSPLRYPGQEEILTQLLAEMDGFNEATGVIVLAATNRADVLDPALLRPGRFDRTIALKLPDEKGRLAILKVHAVDKVLEDDVDLAAIASRAYGLTGADLANITNEAALAAGREGKDVIAQADLTAALKRIMAAPEQQRRLSLRSRGVGKRYTSEDRVTFGDVAGVDDAVEELLEVREFLTDPARFTDLGARVPRGVLLSGPPGCGKTLLARAVAGEANAAFLSAAATEFVQKWVGEGASRVRDLFADARAMAPSILFLDEIDAIGQHRGSWGGHQEHESTLNQILVELDGFEGRNDVIVMAATNRPDMLDSALVRPGRFDRQVTIYLPDRRGRKAILELYLKKRSVRLAPDVDLDATAALTPGMSGADLENVINEAVLLTARNRLKVVTKSMMDEGIDRAMMGIGSRSTIMTDEDKRSVAYHEAGHALVASYLEGSPPPHKVTIIPRGGALGYCAIIEEQERYVTMGSRMIDHMAVSLGGWAAERLIFNDTSSGAGNDLDRVGKIARAMVRNYGMSDVLGPLGYADQRAPDGSIVRPFSEESARVIDDEVRKTVTEAARRAHQVLTTRRAALERIAAALIEKETLDAEEISLLAGLVKPVGRKPTDAPSIAVARRRRSPRAKPS